LQKKGAVLVGPLAKKGAVLVELFAEKKTQFWSGFWTNNKQRDAVLAEFWSGSFCRC
jgi:hypothetical protein